MALLSDDDVPDLATATGQRPSADPPARDFDFDDDDERTLRATLDPNRHGLHRQAHGAVPKAVPPPRRPDRGNARSLGNRDSPMHEETPRIPSMKITAPGLGGGPPPASRSSSVITPRVSALPRINGAGDMADDFIGGTGTATASAPSFVTSSGAIFPGLHLPAAVQIREMGEEEDAGDETESRTLVGALRSASSNEVPQLGADHEDESLTTSAPAFTRPDPRGAPLMASEMPRTWGSPKPDIADSSDVIDLDEPSIATMAAPLPATVAAPSAPPVSAKPGPGVLSALGMMPSLENSDSARKVPSRAPRSLAANIASNMNVTLASEGAYRPPLPSEIDSITTKAPDPKVVDVIRKLPPPPPPIEPIEEVELVDQTKLMANAPPRAASSGSHAVMAIAELRADFRRPPSDSDMRGSPGPMLKAGNVSSDRADVGVLMAVGPPPPPLGPPIAVPSAPIVPGLPFPAHGSGSAPIVGSGSGPFAQPSPSAYARTEKANSTRSAQASIVASDYGVPKKRSYGLLVAMVASVAVAIPLVLFLWLRHGASTGLGLTSSNANANANSNTASASAAPNEAPAGSTATSASASGSPVSSAPVASAATPAASSATSGAASASAPPPPSPPASAEPVATADPPPTPTRTKTTRSGSSTSRESNGGGAVPHPPPTRTAPAPTKTGGDGFTNKRR